MPREGEGEIKGANIIDGVKTNQNKIKLPKGLFNPFTSRYYKYLMYRPMYMIPKGFCPINRSVVFNG